MDLALNNLQRLICHKTQQTKPNEVFKYCAQTKIVITVTVNDFKNLERRYVELEIRGRIETI